MKHDGWAAGCCPRLSQRFLTLSANALVVVTVLVAFVVAVVVPWQLATSQGKQHVLSTVDDYIESLSRRTRDSIRSFLRAAPLAALEAADAFNAGLVNTSDPVAVLREQIFSSQRLSSDWRFRYNCLAMMSGEMQCAAFERETKTVFLQDVSLMADGNLSDQMEWKCGADLWNDSFGGSPYDDLGPYNCVEWVAPMEGTHGVYWIGLNTEVTNSGFIELLNSLYAPLYRGLELIGGISIDLVLQTMSEYLQGLEVSEGSRLFVLQADGLVAGISWGTWEDFPFGLDEEDPLVRWAISKLGMKSNEGWGLNMTEVVIVPERDFTQSFSHDSRVGLNAGIAAVVAGPLLVGIVVVLLLRALVKSSMRVHDYSKPEAYANTIKTGLEVVLESLRKMQNPNMTPAERKILLTNVITALSTTDLHEPDVDKCQMETDQRQWLKREILGDVQSKVPSITAISTELQQITSLLQVETKFDHWDFNVRLSHGCDILIYIFTQVLAIHRVPSDLSIDLNRLHSFLAAVEDSYLNNSFHNLSHAADVVHATHFLLVLENHHTAFGYALLRKSEVLSFLPTAVQREFRRILISLVMATDMAKHFQIMRIHEQAAGYQVTAIPRPQSTENEQARLNYYFIKFIAMPSFASFDELCPIPDVVKELVTNAQHWADALKSTAAPKQEGTDDLQSSTTSSWLVRSVRLSQSLNKMAS
eukprot:m51a1_g706 putative calcium calmodulin-dependent 3 -cyclic nucleotide phosphodiesterase 1c isoform x3 (701) ;mRNA; r:396719-400049